MERVMTYASAAPSAAQPARETIRHYGKYRGTVSDNQDPAARAGSRSRSRRSSPTSTAAGRCRASPYAGDKTGSYAIPPVGAGVWVEFEAGEVSRPIWAGGWWASDKVPTDEGGTKATPDVKLIRSEEGLIVALHDDSKTIAVSDDDGSNILKIEVQGGDRDDQGVDQGRGRRAGDRARGECVPRGGVRRQAHDLPQPARAVDQHAHAPGRQAGPFPVTPMPPTPPAMTPTPEIVSTTVKVG